jgi:hypothetical protein
MQGGVSCQAVALCSAGVIQIGWICTDPGEGLDRFESRLDKSLHLL